MIYFKLYFDEHRDDGLVWELQYIDQDSFKEFTTRIYKEVIIEGDTHLKTKYLGKDSPEPKAFLYGYADGIWNKENNSVLIKGLK